MNQIEGFLNQLYLNKNIDESTRVLTCICKFKKHKRCLSQEQLGKSDYLHSEKEWRNIKGLFENFQYGRVKDALDQSGCRFIHHLHTFVMEAFNCF